MFVSVVVIAVLCIVRIRLSEKRSKMREQRRYRREALLEILENQNSLSRVSLYLSFSCPIVGVAFALRTSCSRGSSRVSKRKQGRRAWFPNEHDF